MSRLCMFCAYTRPRYQVSVCRPIGPLVQKRFPDDVSSLHRLCIASTSCTRSNIATTKERLMISIIVKKWPHLALVLDFTF